MMQVELAGIYGTH